MANGNVISEELKQSLENLSTAQHDQVFGCMKDTLQPLWLKHEAGVMDCLTQSKFDTKGGKFTETDLDEHFADAEKNDVFRTCAKTLDPVDVEAIVDSCLKTL